MAISTNNAIADITPENERLLGRTTDGKNVIQRVQRVLPRWTAITANATIDPEKIYKLNTGTTEVTLKQSGGLFQMLNATALPIMVRAVNFADGTNAFSLEPGVFLQCEGYIDGVGYKYSKMSTNLGTGTSTPVLNTPDSKPPSSETFVNSASPNGLMPGNYKVAGGTTYTQVSTVSSFPATWNYWAEALTTNATVKLNAATSNIPIYFKDVSTWIAATSDPDILVAGDEVVTVILRQFKDSGERNAAIAVVGALSNTVTTCYEIATSWRLNTPSIIKSNWLGTALPTKDNDITEGYVSGSFWGWGDRLWVCANNADGNAKWLEVTEPPVTVPVTSAPTANYAWVNAASQYAANTFLPGGNWVIQGGSSWGYGSVSAPETPPKRWNFWNNGNTSATLFINTGGGDTCNYNEVTQAGGYAIADGSITVGFGEVWQIDLRDAEEFEKTFLVGKLNLVTRPAKVRWAKRLTADASTLKAFGEASVIRVAQDIDASGFNESKLYLIDSLGLGTYNLKCFGKILNSQGVAYTSTTTTVVGGKTQISLDLFKTRTQYLAYRIADDIVIWELSNSGIPSGAVLPSDTGIKIFRLVGHSALPDGLYTRDRNNDWLL